MTKKHSKPTATATHTVHQPEDVNVHLVENKKPTPVPKSTGALDPTTHQRWPDHFAPPARTLSDDQLKGLRTRLHTLKATADVIQERIDTLAKAFEANVAMARPLSFYDRSTDADGPAKHVSPEFPDESLNAVFKSLRADLAAFSQHLEMSEFGMKSLDLPMDKSKKARRKEFEDMISHTILPHARRRWIRRWRS